jgi:hypothetical protein
MIIIKFINVYQSDGGTEGRRDGGMEGRRDGGTEGRRASVARKENRKSRECSCAYQEGVRGEKGEVYLKARQEEG